ncbi:hypothetical protein C2857_006556 [Epichloe festucae Fl1]|uniref:Uncharacterized protein n=1 Tax=Epichloe festucae (strain Fl1) TaxID=877507 RepID=A0A7S9PSQ6_EPIFF|nr:hypothetical protein C2857_006556 [Epichloe festucae Fl1]
MKALFLLALGYVASTLALVAQPGEFDRKSDIISLESAAQSTYDRENALAPRGQAETTLEHSIEKRSIVNEVVLPHNTQHTTTILIGTATVTFLVAKRWWNTPRGTWRNCPNLYVCHRVKITNTAARTIVVNLINDAGQFLLRNYRVNGLSTDRGARIEHIYAPGPREICRLIVDEVQGRPN